MNIQVEPGTVFVLVWRPIKEHHLTFVPTLVRLSDVGQVEGSKTIWGIRGNTRNTPFIPLSTVCWVTVVPDIDGNLQTLAARITEQQNIHIKANNMEFSIIRKQDVLIFCYELYTHQKDMSLRNITTKSMHDIQKNWKTFFLNTFNKIHIRR